MANDDIQLEPPTAKHADVTPAVEDRSYIWYIASALFMAIAGGFVLATLLPLLETGTIPGIERVPRLDPGTWLGTAAGVGRAVRCRHGRPPHPAVRGPQADPAEHHHPDSGVAADVDCCAHGRGAVPLGRLRRGRVVAAGAAGAAGMAGVAAVLLVTLARGRRRGETWEMLAWFGAAWWAVRAVYTLVAAIRASEHGLLTPRPLDDALTWIVMFGAVANFIWAVQSRSVPVFFWSQSPEAPDGDGPGDRNEPGRPAHRGFAGELARGDNVAHLRPRLHLHGRARSPSLPWPVPSGARHTACGRRHQRRAVRAGRQLVGHRGGRPAGLCRGRTAWAGAFDPASPR